MKTIFTLILTIFTTIVSAQSSKKIEVGDFSELKVYDLIEVKLIQSNESKVEISGRFTDEVDVVNKANKLKIRMKLDKVFNGDETYVTVYYKKLNLIDGNEGAVIKSKATITQDFIELRAQEGARVDVNLDVKKVDVKAVSGGVVAIEGKSVSQEVTLNTGGVCDAESFKTENTTVRIKAAGEANIYASKFVDAKVLAGGKVRIYGNPESVKEKTTFGGRVERMD